MGADGKLLGRQRQFGRCAVPGHGSRCVLSHEIQSGPRGRAADKRSWQAEAQVQAQERK